LRSPVDICWFASCVAWPWRTVRDCAVMSGGIVPESSSLCKSTGRL
jgi:hypothetical protein